MRLEEIAKLAKVSTATVSRTINNVSSVYPVLARRVRRVIEEVGYYPNTHARALVSGRSRSFGLIVSDITNPFFPAIVQRFTELGIEHKYEIILSSTAEDPNLLETVARRMIERRVDGVAVLTFGTVSSMAKILRDRSVPVLAMDAPPSELIKSLTIDYLHGMRQAVQHLAALGHVRIAFISGPVHQRSAALRRSAFQECMTEIGLQTIPELLFVGDHTMEGGMKAMCALGALPDRPSAVICSNDLTAIGVMRQAFDLSLDVPGDLSVVGFEDIPMAQFTIPALTAVEISQTVIAETAFRALLQSAQSPKNGSAHQAYTMKTNLVLRSSTGLSVNRRRGASSKH
jgi:LacI family transcriptional regulator, galactose operon repressor